MNLVSTIICPFCQPVLLHFTTNTVERKAHSAATSRILASLLLLILLPVYAYAQQERLDAAIELRNQDGAFSLLIESYRQIQGELVESDYKARLQAAVQLRDPEKKREVIALAAQERDLRFARLAKQLVNLSGAYELIRRSDGRRAGIVVPSTVDTEFAAAKLRKFVPLAVLLPSQQEITRIIRVAHTANSVPSQPNAPSKPGTVAEDWHCGENWLRTWKGNP
jgi:hypothetical protein